MKSCTHITHNRLIETAITTTAAARTITAAIATIHHTKPIKWHGKTFMHGIEHFVGLRSHTAARYFNRVWQRHKRTAKIIHTGSNNKQNRAIEWRKHIHKHSSQIQTCQRHTHIHTHAKTNKNIQYFIESIFYTNAMNPRNGKQKRKIIWKLASHTGQNKTNKNIELVLATTNNSFCYLIE